MANHLTPSELSMLLGIKEREVVRICFEESVPIYQGKVDKALFVQSMEAAGRQLNEPAHDLLASLAAQ
jgi:hypothetical protein